MSDEALTDEQRLFAAHVLGAFVEACPGAGKTRTVVARTARIAAMLAPRKGLAVLSFTNTAVEEFIGRCHVNGIDSVLRHPGFVGTFDAFLRQFFIAPCGIAGVAERPTVVDSWETLGIEVRLRGRNSFRGPGVSLDRFDAATNTINPQTIGYAGLRAHVLAHEAAYEQSAAQRRRGLRGRGYLSAADARVEALQRLQDRGWSDALGSALAARFQEIIVDEAQDCNPLDLQIIGWLRDHGVAVTVVADPDQAIYGFRHGDPDRLLAFAETYGADNRLHLTGNFRSAPSICALAATLRGRADPDESLGDTAEIDAPVHVLTYEGASVPNGIARWFLRIMKENEISPSDAIVLAHGRRIARRACGLAPASNVGGDSKVTQMARVVGAFWSPSASNRARKAALQTVERIVLDMMGKIDSGESPRRAAERNGIDRRWLRRTALELITRLPKSCDDTDDGRGQWVTALHDEIRRHRLTYREGSSERRYFRTPPNAEWNQHLQGADIGEVKCATIHEAKGREFHAVCVVIPPDRGGNNYTAQLFDAWERRANDEAKRVIYVGITRAEKLVALAVPTEFRGRLTAILEAAGVDFMLHNLAAVEAVAKAAAPARQ